MKIAVMPGDGIGQEVTDQAVKVLKAVVGHRLSMELVYAPVGQAGVDAPVASRAGAAGRASERRSAHDDAAQPAQHGRHEVG